MILSLKGSVGLELYVSLEYPVVRAEKNGLSRTRGAQQLLDPKKHNTLDTSFRLKKHNLKNLEFS